MAGSWMQSRRSAMGTKYTCVAALQHDRLESIVNDTQHFMIREDAAKSINRVAMSSTNSIFDSKRLNGRRFHDPSLVQSDIKSWPFNFKAVEGSDDNKLMMSTTNNIRVIAHDETNYYLEMTHAKNAVVTVPDNWRFLLAKKPPAT